MVVSQVILKWNKIKAKVRKMSPLEEAVKSPLRKRVQMTSTYIKEVTYVRGCKLNVPAVSLSELKKGIFLRLLWEERVYIFSLLLQTSRMWIKKLPTVL